MLDWKILAASLVAMLFVSSVFIGGLGIRDILSDLVEKVSGYLGSSPIDNIFPSSQDQDTEGGTVSIFISPKNLEMIPDSEATIISGDTVFSGFTGTLKLNFDNNTAELVSSSLTITFPIETMKIESLTLNTFSMEETKFDIKPDLSTDSGNLQISGFLGEASITPEGIELTGEVSELKVTIGDLDFELV